MRLQPAKSGDKSINQYSTNPVMILQILLHFLSPSYHERWISVQSSAVRALPHRFFTACYGGIQCRGSIKLYGD